LSATPILLVGKVVLSEAALVAVNKGLQVIDERLDSHVKMMKRKRGERNDRASCNWPGREKPTIQ